MFQIHISEQITHLIRQIIDSENGIAKISRNELAGKLGCAPSQINYVITSRFRPENGYHVESRRGGGGYIRITRIQMESKDEIMHIVNSIGQMLDFATATALLSNMLYSGVITKAENDLIMAAISDNTYADIPPILKDTVRARIFKNMLMILNK